jgi:hypothetical protein
MKIHTLSNNATLISISLHGFKFSDGTESEMQDKDVVDKFTLERVSSEKRKVKGMILNETKMVLSEHQLTELGYVSEIADIVLIPFPVLTALREQGVRDHYQNCVAYNATQETQRLPPDQKVVDINNWSY